MSRKRRKPRKSKKAAARPGRSLSPRQNSRLQQAAAAISQGNLAFAEAEYRALVADKVHHPDIFCRLAEIKVRTARPNEAIKLWKQALVIDPEYVEARMNLADFYQRSGELDRSITMYRRIIADNRQMFIAKYLLANVLKSIGDFDEARALYQDVISQQPDYTQAHFSYSGIHTYTEPDDPHLEVMLKLYQGKQLSDESRIHLSFALAKAYENIGDFANAFHHLEAGNELRKREFNYDIESDRALIGSIIRGFSRDAIAGVPVKPDLSKRPIFILGMPRSGTSLVEKILASHSEVHAGGELDYIFSLGSSLFLSQSNFQFAPLTSYPARSFELFASHYLEQLALLDSHSPRVTDKMPFNFMMIGLIRLMLPNAKIIHCARDARDTCLSIYKQNFTTGNYRFAYDLTAIGQFYREYQALMSHWHEMFPGAIYDLNYEALTQSPETEIRKLLAACDLDWQDDCLRFHRSKGVVRTASAFQARQPMYTSSVKLWEKYQPALQPLLDALGENS